MGVRGDTATASTTASAAATIAMTSARSTATMTSWRRPKPSARKRRMVDRVEERLASERLADQQQTGQRDDHREDGECADLWSHRASDLRFRGRRGLELDRALVRERLDGPLERGEVGGAVPESGRDAEEPGIGVGVAAHEGRRRHDLGLLEAFVEHDLLGGLPDPGDAEPHAGAELTPVHGSAEIVEGAAGIARCPPDPSRRG